MISTISQGNDEQRVMWQWIFDKSKNNEGVLEWSEKMGEEIPYGIFYDFVNFDLTTISSEKLPIIKSMIKPEDIN